ncbi:hypothetical protein GQ43DRAFT_223224 [Delitschia confertaspora ATCC 74209]|uniref:Ankyrin repeat protein n=1 Tax=Delitschia confertaspora ATCC 74209 TaxID=1513339 RepID=A0A9P4JD91_9PLEO|nr:hypothetical protein GQ43DRAFT_223224 [Delitschia confertaspora ATCC 74209]
MVEVVGTAAAILQFVDVAVRLSSGLHHLCSEVRNVPRRFHRLQVDLRQQIDVAQHIKTHYLPTFSTTVASSTFDAPLLEYISLADELCNTIDKLLANRSDGLLQRGWVGICSMRKKDEVIQICDRLEHMKITLSMWLSAANLKLSSAVTTTTDLINFNVEETLALAKTANDSASKAAAGAEQLGPQLEQMSRILTDSSERTLQIIRDIQQLKAQSAEILEGGGARAPTSFLANHRSTQILSNTTESSFLISGSSVIDISQVRNAGCSRCTCRTVNSTHLWQLLSFLQFKQTFRNQHLSFCPEYTNSDQSFEFEMQLVPPSYLSSYTINLGMQVRNWRTTKPFSISPIMIGTSRLVDRKLSPAFRAIMDTKEELWEAGLHHICIPKLQNTLQNLFNQQKASALDTDTNGRTLLNEVLWIYIGLGFRRSQQPGDEYVHLIQFLLDKGADPNIISSSASMEASDRFGDRGGTTFDQFAAILATKYYERWYGGRNKLRNLTIFKRLDAAGSEFSKPLNTLSSIHPTYFCESFAAEVEEFTKFEDQIDLCKLGVFVPLILQKSERQFRQAVNKARLSDLNRCSSINGLAPIHFAVLWPTGLKILIDKGANINPKDKRGRRPIYLAVVQGVAESVKHLIDADCAVYSPGNDDSLLQHALKLESPRREHILDLLSAALIDRHTRLIEMARELLPDSVFLQLNISEGQINERYAPRISEVLISHGINIPEALELDAENSVYAFSDMHGCIRMTPGIANVFWNAGFKAVDEPDDFGCTPFLQSWFCANFEMVHWFAEKGVSLSSRHRDAPLTALHLYAERINYPGGFFSFDIDSVPTDEYYMARIQENLGIPYDGCTCLCSPNGCTPIKKLSRNVSRKNLFRKFLQNVNPEKALLQQYIREFTRCLLFDFLGGKHSCCTLGQHCNIETRHEYSTPRIIQDKPQKILDEYHKKLREHRSYCVDGIPTPSRQETSLITEDAELLKTALDGLMEHYDEMPRPDTMLPEEQPFQYINWIIAEGCFVGDVEFECTHKGI